MAFTIEASRKGGRVSGRNNVLSGQILRAQIAGGRVQGRINAENGTLEKARAAHPSVKAQLRWTQANCVDLPRAARAANHQRWHVARNRPNFEKCEFCRERIEEQ